MDGLVWGGLQGTCATLCVCAPRAHAVCAALRLLTQDRCHRRPLLPLLQGLGQGAEQRLAAERERALKRLEGKRQALQVSGSVGGRGVGISRLPNRHFSCLMAHTGWARS